MLSATPASTYSHPRLIQLIQEPQPEHDSAVRAVHKAEALVQDMRQALRQAEQKRHSRSKATMVWDMRQALMQAEQQLEQAQAQQSAAADHPSPTGALAAGSEAAGDAKCLLEPFIVG